MTVQRFTSLRDGLDFEDAVWAGAVPGLVAWLSAPGIAVPPSHLRAPNFRAAAHLSMLAGRPVERRRSGGGAVPQGPGVLNIGWIPHAGQGRGIRGDYDAFAHGLIEALATTGVAASIHSPHGAWCPGAHDVSVGGRKIAGLSQRRSAGGGAAARSFVHAALFVEPSLEIEFNFLKLYLEAASIRDWPRASAATTLAAECAAFARDGENILLEIVATMESRLRMPSRTSPSGYLGMPHAAL